ncbi:MAG: DNA polymerase III subunit alpha [Candidatus Izemoplasmatales bacterium]|nr:DNA polymerase III subunit alpha [Candidatus Izemoplasmatales bacterium]
MIDFDLFVQTGYSFNGSIISIDKVIDLASERGYKTLGIADNNRLYGVLKFYHACIKNGLKPIIGMHVVLEIADGLVAGLLFAANIKGYQNLIKISSRLEDPGALLEMEILSEFREGLILVLRTDRYDIKKTITGNDNEGLKHYLGILNRNVDKMYLGIDLADFTSETIIAPAIRGRNDVVVINRVLYYDKSDRRASKVLRELLVQEHADEAGLFEGEEAINDFKTLAELDKLHADYLGIVNNTKELIDSIDLKLEYRDRLLPKYPIKGDYSAREYLMALSQKGLERRLKAYLHPRKQVSEYQARLQYELGVIFSMGYEDYFLIVWDFVLYAKRRGILVGPGRGSAAGSLVSYVLGIVDVDPLEHDLYFERFLNPERITMPDIDMDFPDDKRDQVIEYVAQKYGKLHVTNIIAFGTYQGKSALRDVSRILNIKPMIVDEVTKYVGETQNSITEFIKESPAKYDNLMQIPEVKDLFEIAMKIVDQPRHISTHAAGIIISDQEITDLVPVQKGLLNLYQTQFEATDLEKVGLLKIDFLGIRNLTVIARVIDLIREKKKKNIDIYKIPFNDQPTFKLLQEARTLGIFQLESQGMINLVLKMKIANFTDVATCIALFRPGPMENIPQFLRRRNKQEKVTYPHPDLEVILDYTEGIIVYQEQIMQIANVFAGYSLGEADVLRRAVSKKSEKILVEERERFVAKCLEKHHSEALSNQIYDYIVKFANYGFNKSHAVAYAVVAYWMAYLKANYPGFFMTALMDFALGSQNATIDYLKECRKLNIEVLPPRINLSGKSYRVENNSLRYPYLGIRNIGNVVAERIEAIQNDKEVTGLVDFLARGRDINAKVIESLILVGVFDEFGETKQTLVENYKQIILGLNLGQNLQEVGFVFLKYPEYDNAYLAEKERELLGFNLSFHPLKEFFPILNSHNIKALSDAYLEIGRKTDFGGLLTRIKTIKTKDNQEMSFLEFQDQGREIEAVLFPRAHMIYKEKLIQNTAWIVSGNVEERNGKIQIIIDKLEMIGGDK